MRSLPSTSVLAVVISLACVCASRAQEQPHARLAPNTLHFELLGSTGVYSLNYDRLLTRYASVRIGAMVVPFFGVVYGFPLTANVLLRHGNHAAELGGGPVFVHERYSERPLLFSDPDANYGWASESRVYGTLTLAYRYQPSKIGPFWRLGYSYSLGERIHRRQLSLCISAGISF